MALVNINKLDTSGEWMVGSSHLYIPATPCKVEHSNVVGSGSGRSEDGIMRIDWVRRDVRKVFLNYKAMSAHELAYTIGLLQGKEFTFKFKDQGSVQTMNAYVGESKYQFYTDSSLYDEGIYIDVEINVIEL